MGSSMWGAEHVDFIERLVRENGSTSQEIATRMSRHFGCRITASHVNALMTRMRRPRDSLFRNLPYLRGGARYTIS